MVAQKKQPIKKFNNNPPKKEVNSANCFKVDTKKQTKTTNENECESDTDSNFKNNTGPLKGQHTR